MNDPSRLQVVVLISGGGTNLQALTDPAAAGQPFAIAGVVSNRPDAFGLTRAARAGIPTAIVDHTCYPDRESFEVALAERVDGFAPQLDCLAGFMRILTPAFVSHYRGRMLNIHPSLLPRYRGLQSPHFGLRSAWRRSSRSTRRERTGSTCGGSRKSSLRGGSRTRSTTRGTKGMRRCCGSCRTSRAEHATQAHAHRDRDLSERRARLPARDGRSRM